LRVLEPKGAKLKILPTHPPPSSIDAPNEGTRMIGFETSVPASRAQRLVVQLVPASATGETAPVVPLAQW
jgi:hypothetical protein